ncbi:Nn.00g098670.m01.CDS01 [Neocucurbitaria sp. VM-36]
MKVAEKATDRTAEVHIYAEGKVNALEEYGEYISSEDKAICCYVPVEEGFKIRIRGKFSGTTLSIAYDTVVDGVLRKANSYNAKDVHLQRKRIDMETFLYKTDKGIIDTDMLVARLPDWIATQLNEDPETIGTMELRLYLTRQLGVSHTIGSVEKYYTTRNHIEDKTEHTTSYKQIAPTYQMRFEQNSALLEKNKTTREQRKLNAPRPGIEPWAIFRFHYRGKDAIVDKYRKPTFDPLNEAKIEPHILVLDPVPPLRAGTKPQKDDGDSSTRASSPMPPDLPSTPAKATYKGSASESITSTDNQQTATAIPFTTIAKSTEDMPSRLSDNSLLLGTTADLGEDLHARVDLKPTPKPPTKVMTATDADETASNQIPDRSISPSTVRGHSNAAPETASDIVTSDKIIEMEHEKADDTDKATHPPDKVIEKDTVTNKHTIAVMIPKAKATTSTEASATTDSNLTNNGAKLTNGNPSKSTVQPNGIVKKASQPPKPSLKERGPKPMPINTSIPAAQSPPAPPTVPVTPTKRPSAIANGLSPEMKRAKIATNTSITSAPITPSKVSQTSPGFPSPKPMSIERQVAEQRKKLEMLRKKRFEMATKQSTIDKEMEPYKKHMAEELERLKAEMMEEENAYAEEEEHYSASVEILGEFKKVDDST